MSASSHLSLERGQGKDAGDIVVQVAVLLLAEVSHNVASVAVRDGHHVEQEGLHIIVEGFVVQKGLGNQAEILTILFVLLPANLKY